MITPDRSTLIVSLLLGIAIHLAGIIAGVLALVVVGDWVMVAGWVVTGG